MPGQYPSLDPIGGANLSSTKVGDIPSSATNPNIKARGVATTFNSKNQYDITSLSYPDDLMSTDYGQNYVAHSEGLAYGQNYVVFYINVSNDSKLLKDPSNVTVSDFPPRDQGELAGMKVSEGQAMLSSAAGGLIAGGALGSILSRSKGAIPGAAVVGGSATLGVAATGSQTSSFSKQQKRLSAAIAMHIPNALAIRYSTNWGEEDTKAFALLSAGSESIWKAVESSNIDQLTPTMKTIAAAVALDKIPGAAAISAASGLAANPRKEQVFKSVDFRTFFFDYQFFPRSAEEARNVINIIYQFKLHMHPEFKDSSNFLYIYPSEFDIYYYQGTTENMNIHRHTSCVLTEMNIGYAPQGQFTTFDNGMPTQINLTLNFKELGLLTKEKIQDGF